MPSASFVFRFFRSSAALAAAAIGFLVTFSFQSSIFLMLPTMQRAKPSRRSPFRKKDRNLAFLLSEEQQPSSRKRASSCTLPHESPQLRFLVKDAAASESRSLTDLSRRRSSPNVTKRASWCAIGASDGSCSSNLRQPSPPQLDFCAWLRTNWRAALLLAAAILICSTLCFLCLLSILNSPQQSAADGSLPVRWLKEAVQQRTIDLERGLPA